MKIKTLENNNLVFNDLAPGDVFSLSLNKLFYMKVASESADAFNAVHLSPGDKVHLNSSDSVVYYPKAILLLNGERE
jgi:hypothetical protein